VGLGKAGKKSRPRDVTASNSAHGSGHDAIGDSGAGAVGVRIETIVHRAIGAAVEVMDRDGDVDIVVRK
jgi:hypothetical protein